nr:MAG TPA: hypothetical protein [Caudoviricetes sp.]
MMDETKLAGCKRTLIQAAKQMAEEYSDAMKYADFAVEYKSVCPSAAAEWYKLSGDEMEHAEINSRIGQKVISMVESEDSAAVADLRSMWEMAEELVSGLHEAVTKQRTAYVK